MKNLHVKDLMIPLAEYATVSQDATLFDAIQALKKAQAKFDQNRYPHRAILVYDEDKKVVGKLSQMDIIKSLEPNYAEKLDVTLDNLLVSQPDCGEQALDVTELLVRSNAVDVIVTCPGLASATTTFSPR